MLQGHDAVDRVARVEVIEFTKRNDPSGVLIESLLGDVPARRILQVFHGVIAQRHLQLCNPEYRRASAPDNFLQQILILNRRDYSATCRNRLELGVGEIWQRQFQAFHKPD